MSVIKGSSENVLLIGALVVMAGSFCFCQAVSSQVSEIKLTGIVLTVDHRCAKTHVKEFFGRTSDWAIASG
jgi:hypothetical protein